MKKLLSSLLALTLTVGLLASCSPSGESNQPTPSTPTAQRTSSAVQAQSTIHFTDSCGRKVEIPAQINRIAPSGPLAQILLYAIAPEKMVGWSKKPSEKQAPFLKAVSPDLPEFGQFYGKHSSLNLESVLSANPQVIFDLGDQKKTHKEDMDKIQEQTHIPTIFIRATLDNYPEAFRQLGKLLHLEDRAEKLAKFCEDTIKMAKEKAAQIPEDKRLSVYYGTGKAGLDANAKGSIHATVLELIGAKNAIEVPEVSNKGGGNPINMEQLLKAQPDFIALDGPFAQEYGKDSAWQALKAVQNHHVYAIPHTPYGFLSSPPSINQLAGVYWLGQMVYPEIYNYDLVQKIQEFYKLFLHYDLSKEEAEKILKQ